MSGRCVWLICQFERSELTGKQALGNSSAGRAKLKNLNLDSYEVGADCEIKASKGYDVRQKSWPFNDVSVASF